MQFVANPKFTFCGTNLWGLQLHKRFEGNFMLRYLVEYTFTGLSAEKDYQDVVEFFKDKDTSKYSQALAQALETIRAKIGWIGVG
jgi:aminopeptidase 2